MRTKYNNTLPNKNQDGIYPNNSIYLVRKEIIRYYRKIEEIIKLRLGAYSQWFVGKIKLYIFTYIVKQNCKIINWSEGEYLRKNIRAKTKK